MRGSRAFRARLRISLLLVAASQSLPGPAMPVLTFSMSVETAKLFGIRLHRVTMKQTIALLLEWMREDRPCRYVVTPNVDHVVKLQSHPAMRAAYRRRGSDGGRRLAAGGGVAMAGASAAGARGGVGPGSVAACGGAGDSRFSSVLAGSGGWRWRAGGGAHSLALAGCKCMWRGESALWFRYRSEGERQRSLKPSMRHRPICWLWAWAHRGRRSGSIDMRHSSKRGSRLPRERRLIFWRGFSARAELGASGADGVAVSIDDRSRSGWPVAMREMSWCFRDWWRPSGGGVAAKPRIGLRDITSDSLCVPCLLKVKTLLISRIRSSHAPRSMSRSSMMAKRLYEEATGAMKFLALVAAIVFAGGGDLSL